MPKIEYWFKQDLKKPVRVNDLNGVVFTLDNVGSRIGVEVFDDGEPVTLTGTVNGYVIIPGETTVSVAGTHSDNKAYIELPQSALATPGFIKIAIKLTNSSEITTLLAVVATVYRSRTDTIITPSQQIITDWSQQIAAEMQAVTDISAVQNAKIEQLSSWLTSDFKYIAGEFNLLEEATWTEGYSISSTGVISESSSFKYSSLIPVGNNNYKLFWNKLSGSSTLRVHGYDSNGDWDSQLAASSTGATISFSGEGISYIRISCNKTNDKLLCLAKSETLVDKIAENKIAAEDVDRKADAIIDEISTEFGTIDILSGDGLTSGKCIEKDGTTRTGSDWSYTDFIRINCRNLMFTCPEHSYSWVLTEAASVAFYTLANESSFITGSAVDVIEGTIGKYRWIVIPVPDTAKYLRASVLTALTSSYKMIGLNSYNTETQINPASGEHDDLDNYKKIGTYTVPSEGAAGRIYNAPFSVGFRLIVGNVNNYNSVYQIAIANETNGIAIRTYDTVNGVWRDWSKGFATAKTVTLDYNEDLNDCTDPGEYIIPNGGVAKSLENCPFTVGGKMTVGKVNNVNSAYQLIMANQENGIAYRTYDAGNSRWRGWSVMESSPEHTTVIEVGTGKEYTSLVECLDDVTSVDMIGTWNENNRLVIQLGEGEYKMDSVVDLYRETKKPDEEIQTQEDRGPYRWGVYMPRYCTIKGAGKTKTKITFDYQGEEETGKDDGWIMGHIAALNMPYEGGLEDLSIIVQNCRYCVHADGGITSVVVDGQTVARGKTAWLNNLKATIKNVSFIHNGQDQSILDPDDYDYPCAWGSGIRNNVYREFINCEFIAANCPGWSTHNYPANTESAEHRFVNCKFINTETRFAFSYRRASLEFLSWGSDIPINVYLENCYAGRYINLGVNANGSTGALTSKCDFFVHDDGGNFIIPKTTNDAHKMQSWFNRNCIDVMPGSGVTIVAYKPYDINSDWRAVGYGTDANAIMRGIAINDTAAGDTITGSVYVQTKGYVSLDLLGVTGFSAGATIDYVNGAWVQDSVDPLIRVLTANIGELI